MMQRSFLLCLVLFAAGCGADLPPSYVFFGSLPRVQEWTQVYPASRDRDARKYVLMNDVTGERIDFFSHPTLYRSSASVAGELKVGFAQVGDVPSDIVESRTGRIANFRVRFANGEAGEVVVFRSDRIRDCIVAVGHWPVAYDAQALADMNAIIATMDVLPED